MNLQPLASHNNSGKSEENRSGRVELNHKPRQRWKDEQHAIAHHLTPFAGVHDSSSNVDMVTISSENHMSGICE